VAQGFIPAKKLTARQDGRRIIVKLGEHKNPAARVALAFVVLNASAVAGLFALWRGREVWR
jgi:hypothetical protein